MGRYGIYMKGTSLGVFSGSEEYGLNLKDNTQSATIKSVSFVCLTIVDF